MQRRTFLQTSLLGLLPASATLAPSASVALAPGPRPRAPRQEPASGARTDRPLRLSANENPLGMSPAARAAVVDGVGDAHRYPYALHQELVETLARQHGVQPSQVVLGAGSTEVLQMAVQAFAAPPPAVFVIAEPTFEDVPRYAEPWALRVVRVPLRADHAHDLARMRAAAEAAGGPAVVFVCNPNNPTGTLTPSRELDEWIEAANDRTTFLVDEAYCEFAASAEGYRTALPWVAKRPNVIVTRTFSKVHGMAGLRIGYGVAHADTAARLRRLRSHNDCNVLGLLAARASLRDGQHVQKSLQTNAAARTVVEDVLRELELAWLPSHANFVMHEIRGDLGEYAARMREAGILVGRPFPPLLGHNRLSLGTPDDMARFAEVLRGFRRKGWV